MLFIISDRASARRSSSAGGVSTQFGAPTGVRAGQVVLGTAQTPSTAKLQRPECKKSKKKVDTDRTRTCAADANRFLVDLLNQDRVA